MDLIYIVVWDDDNMPGGLNAQAYTTREAAERDFPLFPSGGEQPVIVESTIQS